MNPLAGRTAHKKITSQEAFKVLHLGWATPQGCCVGSEPINPLAGTTAHKKNTSQEAF